MGARLDLGGEHGDDQRRDAQVFQRPLSDQGDNDDNEEADYNDGA